MRRGRSLSGERGAILPLFALLIVLLLVFSAFAVDLGSAWAQRRTSQTAADASVMAAALQYLRPAPPDETGLFDLVNDYANANLEGGVLTFDDWAGCSDPDRPVDYEALGTSGTWDYPGAGLATDLVDCISIKQVNNEPAILRVRLPVTEVPTAFARVIGIEDIAVSAFAEAEVRYLDQKKILPFSLPSNPGTQECLGTPPSGLLPNDEAPCTGPAQGNFGMIDSPWFGAPAPYGTDSDPCPNDPNFKNRTPTNLALGLDHIITGWPDDGLDGDPFDYDGPGVGTNLPNNHVAADSCDNAGNDIPPYVLLTETGNTQTGGEIMEDGFLGAPQFGTNSEPGRLRQLPTDSVPGTVSGTDVQTLRIDLRTISDTKNVDNVGMWDYLDFSVIDTGGTGDCRESSFTGLAGRDLTDQMLRCLTVGKDPFTGAVISGLDPAPVFTDALLESPRFALVPVLNYASGAQFGSKWWAVMNMQPVYVQTTWYRCGQPTGECLFEPDDFDTYVPPPTGTTTTTTTLPPSSTTTSTTAAPSPEDGKTVFFNPGEGSVEPCLVKNSNCVIPKTMVMAGSSAFVIQDSWLSDEAQNAIGGSSPYEVFLRR